MLVDAASKQRVKLVACSRQFWVSTVFGRIAAAVAVWLAEAVVQPPLVASWGVDRATPAAYGHKAA